MYIPCLLKPRDEWVKAVAIANARYPDTGSFTLQNNIDPKMIAKRFNNFKFNKYLNEFGFCDEAGVEYFVHCYLQMDRSPAFWGTVVTIYDSLDPAKDVTSFSSWLCHNFTKK